MWVDPQSVPARVAISEYHIYLCACYTVFINLEWASENWGRQRKGKKFDNLKTTIVNSGEAARFLALTFPNSRMHLDSPTLFVSLRHNHQLFTIRRQVDANMNN